MVHDEDCFPNWGKYRNIKYGEIPAEYLLWVDANIKLIDMLHGEEVRQYIKENKGILLTEYKAKFKKDYGR